MTPFSVVFMEAMHFGVIAGVSLPGNNDPVPADVIARLPPAEQSLARDLRGFRQPDFVGGRLALQRAMRGLGRPVEPVLVGPRGEPVLPRGVAGSVSHKRRLAVAIAARDTSGTLGIDLEDLGGPPRAGIAERVLSPSELADLAGMPEDRRWTAILLRFSLKESVYKAIHPYVNRYVDFLEAEVHPDVDLQAEVRLSLAQGEGPFRVEARYHWLEDHLVTMVRAAPLASDDATPPE